MNYDNKYECFVKNEYINLFQNSFCIILFISMYIYIYYAELRGFQTVSEPAQSGYRAMIAVHGASRRGGSDPLMFDVYIRGSLELQF